MVSFRLFIDALHRAISDAASSLMNSNDDVLNKFFVQKSSISKDGTEDQVLIPKTVKMEYPVLNNDGNIEKGEVQVPLITLIPVCATKIEKATLTSEFGLSVDDHEVQINFVDSKLHQQDVAYGKLEVIIAPDDVPKGVELLINGYNNILKRQIP